MRYIIVTGGPLPQESAKLIKELSASDEDTILVACDGGCDILARNNIVPDLVVGDMDSISEEDILGAVKKVLTDPSYKENAIRISDSFHSCGGAAEARAFLETITSTVNTTNFNTIGISRE